MVKKIYPKGKALIEKFISTIGGHKEFEVLRKDALCLFKFEGKCYYAYFKCVSPEGNPHPLEHQRAQLPHRPEFEEVKNSPLPFLFLGYDVDSDVFICWEPHKVKPRLNKKSYVSFYSRLSAQQSVVEGKVKEEVLTNGDKFVLFKRIDCVSFLQMIDTHFPELKPSDGSSPVVSEPRPEEYDETKGVHLKGRILDVDEDDSVRLLIDSYPEDASILTIIGDCMNQYGHYYSKMHFSDWGKIVRTYLCSKHD